MARVFHVFLLRKRNQDTIFWLHFYITLSDFSVSTSLPSIMASIPLCGGGDPSPTLGEGTSFSKFWRHFLKAYFKNKLVIKNVLIFLFSCRNQNAKGCLRWGSNSRQSDTLLTELQRLVVTRRAQNNIKIKLVFSPIWDLNLHRCGFSLLFGLSLF